MMKTTLNQPRLNARYKDLTVAQLRHQGVRKHFNRPLCCCISGWPRTAANNARNIHQVPRPLGNEVLHKHVCKAERSLNIDAHHAAEPFNIDRLDNSRFKERSIIEADIAPPKAVERSIEQRLRQGFIAEVAFNYRAGTLQLRGQ